MTGQTYDQLQAVIDDFLEVVQRENTPPTRYKSGCPDCCHGNLCEKVI